MDIVHVSELLEMARITGGWNGLYSVNVSFLAVICPFSLSLFPGVEQTWVSSIWNALNLRYLGERGGNCKACKQENTQQKYTTHY